MKKDIDARSTGEGKGSRAQQRKTRTEVYDRPKRIATLIDSLSPKHRRLRVFQDMVTMMGCAISNSLDKQQAEKREAMYEECARRYTVAERAAFPEMLAELTMHLEDAGPDDVLGQLFMRLELYNEHRGQYFTPMHLCDLMARIPNSTDMKGKVNQQGFVTATDPASGGGAMLIAFAKNMAHQGLSYQRQLHATAVDIDFTAAMMSYVQLSLLHIPAIVVHGDTLTLEEFSAWRTPAHIMGNWDHKLRRHSAEVVEQEPDDYQPAQTLPATR